ncbi:MAG: oligoendopeptidase F [Thermoflexales bacterium]|nr:oligoendopeptidase F [Thermoflexales bacterium]
MSPATVPARSEIPAEATWDTAALFATPEAWEAELKAVDAELPKLLAFKGRLGDNAATLADYLALQDALSARLNKLFMYANLNHSVDTADPVWLARNGQVMAFLAKARAAMAFYRPEVLRIGAATLARWEAQDARLAVYAHAFDALAREVEHVRSDEVEELLSQASDSMLSARRVHGILTDADLRYAPATDDAGQAIELALGNIASGLQSPDRTLRKTVWRSDRDAHLGVKNTLAACLSVGMKQDVFLARARRYGSSLEAALAPHNLPVEVFHNLIAVFRKNAPTWHRYFRARRKALGVDVLSPWDIVAPLTTTPVKVPYAQAVEWICAGMAPLGDDYVQVARAGLTKDRWVDIYPNKGKRQGAFSSGSQGTKPYIFISYNDSLFSMSTLAHELGHSMHSYYARSEQPFVYANYSLFVAEVASNFNQAMVRAHLLATHPGRDFQIAMIEEAMSNFGRYFLIMPTLARFELEVHERVERGEGLSADGLNKLMLGLFREAYGDAMQIDDEDGPRVGITWGQFATHLYSNFYPFQYATGISAAHALADRILNGAPGAVADYRAMLRAGSALYPLDALKLAGVDMTRPEPVEKAFALLAGLVDRLEGLIA